MTVSHESIMKMIRNKDPTPPCVNSLSIGNLGETSPQIFVKCTVIMYCVRHVTD